jgi:hypothetical protein
MLLDKQKRKGVNYFEYKKKNSTKEQGQVNMGENTR